MDLKKKIFDELKEGDVILSADKNVWRTAKVVKISTSDPRNLRVQYIGDKKKKDEWISMSAIKKYTRYNHKKCKVVGKFREIYTQRPKDPSKETKKESEVKTKPTLHDKKFKKGSHKIDEIFEDGNDQEQEGIQEEDKKSQ